MTDREFTIGETYAILLFCVAILSGVAGWIAHGLWR